MSCDARRAAAQRLVDGLAARGALAPGWAGAFLAVLREDLLPDLVWAEDEDAGFVPVCRRDDPERWLQLARGDGYVVTQINDGADDGTVDRVATSSASMPLMVATMLRLLDVRNNHRVLEVGTGTGWNAALLAFWLGAENVTTIEIDAAMAERARQALARMGFAGVTVVAGDGERGYASTAPYDRIISTAACQVVPPHWVSQVNPGGLILTPWVNELYTGGLLLLTAAEGVRRRPGGDRRGDGTLRPGRR